MADIANPPDHRASHVLFTWLFLGLSVFTLCMLAFQACNGSIRLLGTGSGAHVGTLKSHSKSVYLGTVMTNFRETHHSLLKKMEEITDSNTVREDLVAMHYAVVKGDEDTALQLTAKYKEADPFLPAYFVGAEPAERAKIQAFAKEHSDAAAVRELMKLANKKDKSKDVWPYRAEFLKYLEGLEENNLKQSKEIWASCPISRKPDLFVTVSGYGPMSKRLYSLSESSKTAGEPRIVRTRSGKPFIGFYGDELYLPDTYAREVEAANECVFEKTGKEIVIDYTLRSSYKQTVVKSKVQGNMPGGGKCSALSANSSGGKVERFLRGTYRKVAGIGLAASPGESRHVTGAIDFSYPGQEMLEECMPKYWKPCLGGEDCNHWQPDVNKPIDGSLCTTVVSNLSSRKFCFNGNPDEEATREAAEAVSTDGYTRVPQSEVPSDLVRTKASPAIVAMSEKIQDDGFGGATVEKVREGEVFVFRYDTPDGERFCKVEVHDNHKARGVFNIVRGKSSTIYNVGCSTYKRSGAP